MAAQITLFKDFANCHSRGQDVDTRADALLRFVVSSGAAKHLRYQNGTFLPDSALLKEPIEVAKGVHFKVVACNLGANEAEVTNMTVAVASDELTSKQLQAFLDACNTQYQADIQNKLGECLYVFDLVTKDNGVVTGRGGDIRGGLRPAQCGDAAGLHVAPNNYPPHLQFTRNKFTSTRTLENVFLADQDTLRDRVEFFTHRRDWYEQKGIPYTLGLLLHGRPGAGKTSCIKALANYTQRHVINVSLEAIRTKTQLKNLFFSDALHVTAAGEYGRDNFEIYNIPAEKRLYVIEDVDCMSDLVLDRTLFEQDRARVAELRAALSALDAAELARTRIWDGRLRDCLLNEEKERHRLRTELAKCENASLVDTQAAVENRTDTVTLSALLNVLDGSIEATGRMLVLTSNYPERLDKALVRKGRIDVAVHFTLATPRMIQDMYSSFYDIPFPTDLAAALPENFWVPADVSAVLLKHFRRPEQAAADLANRVLP